ncbi:MAG: tannase/feruloyl esterase family alpha/beta hydrolase [Hydrogenophaga sp.]|uniref:tannase/feruloyl esterase family alpha/beta hydrolase n=1 Tax=Hydrogenophaga sp. TaxID=1904254 RepID=UPI0025C1148C|nr:tannase/feruloyl esterase family alpha/beta hydrolase [Hydrogenophaga sp.]MBU7572059.1 tannase/feruloyl esterase family alpha/beta hydrolase [Hydrogenophaga sp.]
MPASLSRLPLLAVITLAACGGGSDNPAPTPPPSAPPPIPQLGQAAPAALVGSCADLALRLAGLANTTLTASTDVAAGALTVGGQPVPAHCRVTGKMFERTSAVDGNTYAISFEVRLPLAWNGRFFHQGNGGIDGSVVTATGAEGGGPLTHALHKGFAVLSSDAGHAAAMGPFFGIDPQARLDYGYQAAAKLTPMAKNLLAGAYGKGPDRSYFGGCSNGGRHVFNAFARMPEQYDGYLAGAPGYNLPKSAVANIFGGQRYASVATDPADISTGFTNAERATVAAAVLAKCDALDGATDGLIQDVKACQSNFSLAADVPTCPGARDGSCLSSAQKTAIAPIFSGATTSTGAPVYSSFPYDAGIGSGGIPFWEFTAPVALDSGAVGVIFAVPPADPLTFNGPSFALTGSIDAMFASISATNATYTESAMSFMTPPNPTQLSRVRDRGAKIMVYHGVSDPIFSSDDSVSWVKGVATNHADANAFARLYLVPGMGHCSGGPATDQFDMLASLVDWVERGVVPDRVTASARGAGNLGGVNAETPAGWAANRTRPLCPWPQVARYNGSGSLDSASSFSCRP